MKLPGKSKRDRPPTLADVGRTAGVSAMAVSAVLNGTKSSVRISVKTQERIRKAAAELNYRPNIAARALVNRRMDTIGVFVVVDAHELNHYFLEVFNGVLEGAARHGQNVTIFSLKTWSDARAQLERAFDGRIDGMILIAPIVLDGFSKGMTPGMPCVSLHANSRIDGMLNIESDEEKGAHDIVQYLVAKGHSRILHLAGPVGLIGAERRIRGYQAALTAAGIAPSDNLLVRAGFSKTEGYTTMKQHLSETSGDPLPHAIFCVNDLVALGCMEALAEVGLRVPDDVSVCGFDDTLIAKITVPQLTTVRQPLQAMGIKAVSILIERIEKQGEDSDPQPSEIVFATELVTRASVVDRKVD